MTIRWYPVGPCTHEATHGPYLARLTPLRGCSEIMIFRNGVYLFDGWGNAKQLRAYLAGFVERVASRQAIDAVRGEKTEGARDRGRH